MFTGSTKKGKYVLKSFFYSFAVYKTTSSYEKEQEGPEIVLRQRDQIEPIREEKTGESQETCDEHFV